MAGFYDTYTAKVDSEDIKGSISRALKDTRQTPDEGVRTVSRHGIYISPLAPLPLNGFIKAVAVRPQNRC